MLYKLLTLALLLLTAAACAPAAWFIVSPAYSVTSTPPPALPVGEAATVVPQPAAPVNSPALVWEGMIESPDTGALGCQRLELGGDVPVRVGACGSTGLAKQFVAQRGQEWAEIQARFASFDYRSAADRLVFRGAGTISGAEWQRAILSWVRTFYQEESSGRVGAAVRTKMSWMLAPLAGQPGRCAHLAVLSFAYAFADTFPCQGGGVAQDTQSGWLEPQEMVKFDAWLYSRASYSANVNYFEGSGTQAVSAQDIEEMAAWAQSVYLRLKPSEAVTPVPATQAPGPVPTLTPGSNGVPASPPWKSYTSAKHHYVVNYPADWTINVQTPGAGNDPEYVDLRPSGMSLPAVQIYALKGEPPITGFENCDKNLIFRDTLACSISLSRGQNPAQQLLIFQKGESYYQIGVQYEDQQQLGVFEDIVKSFQFTQ